MKEGILVLVAVFSIALIACDSVAENAVGPAQRLPKIRVAEEGRAFITENGKPFAPVGVNYYRPARTIGKARPIGTRSR